MSEEPKTKTYKSNDKKESIDKQKDAIKKFKQQTAVQKDNNKKLKEMVKEMQFKMDDQKKSTQEENKQIESTFNNLRSQINKLNQELISLTNTIDTEKDKQKDNNDKKSDSKQSIKNQELMEIEIKDLKEDLKKRNDIIKDYENDKNKQTTQLDEFQQFKEENISLINELHSELKEKEDIIDDLRNGPTPIEKLIINTCKLQFEDSSLNTQDENLTDEQHQKRLIDKLNCEYGEISRNQKGLLNNYEKMKMSNDDLQLEISRLKVLKNQESIHLRKMEEGFKDWIINSDNKLLNQNMMKNVEQDLFLENLTLRNAYRLIEI